MKGQLARIGLSVRGSYRFISFIWHLEIHRRSDPSAKNHSLKYCLLSCPEICGCVQCKLKYFLLQSKIECYIEYFLKYYFEIDTLNAQYYYFQKIFILPKVKE